VTRPVRIANCSGFYGDRPAAAAEMVEGGPIDVLTGDYLAELTMLILWKARQKDSRRGYASTFLDQMEEVLGTCLDKGIRIVTNAGGLNPSGLAADLHAMAARLGLAPQIGYVEGDDLVDRVDDLIAQGHPLAHMDTGQPLAEAGVRPISANAYLGGWGIAAVLDAGADVVVCPRVTDASLVVGPAAWWHGWARHDYDRLAGAVVAGHVIECGPQATGGNYAFLHEITDRRYPGFPIAEVEADGSSVITKHPDTGGLVSPGTVTAQLLYEIAAPEYLNPDVVAHFDTVAVESVGPHRVRLSDTRGSPPPSTVKVAMNYLGGYKNTMTLVLTGLDIEEKAAWAEEELFIILGGKDSFEQVDVRLIRSDHPDADRNELNTAQLRITVKDGDPAKVGRRFSNATVQLALAGYAGFHTTTPPSSESAFGVYWPALVPAECVTQVAVLPDQTRLEVPPSAGGSDGPAGPAMAVDRHAEPAGPVTAGPTVRRPLGLVCGARSGDKGGNANVGLWTRDLSTFEWLRSTLTVDGFKALVPECAGLAVHRYELPNLLALNFVVVGLLGDGVAATTRPDPQAKGFGEFIRSRVVDLPEALVPDQPRPGHQPGPAGG
jgi:hypothetical protein